MMRKGFKLKITFILFVLIVFQFLFYSVIHQEKEKLLEIYQKNSLLIERYQKNIEKLPELKKENKVLIQKRKSLEERTLKGKNETIAYTELLSIISNIFKKLGIKGEYITKLPSKSFDSITIIRVNVRFNERSFRKVLDFINSIENNNKKILFFDYIQLTTSFIQKDVVYLKINANIGGVWLKHGEGD